MIFFYFLFFEKEGEEGKSTETTLQKKNHPWVIYCEFEHLLSLSVTY